MANILDQIEKDLFQAIESDALTLPTLPEIALQIREAAEDDNSTAAQLSKVISLDAAISARVVRVANSPLLRAQERIDDLGTAISRLGIRYSSNLATGLAMEQIFQATNDLIDKKMREVWSNSVETASICHVIAKHYTRLPVDQVTLAGLLHQIGVLPILMYIEDKPKLLFDSIVDRIIEKLHPKLGHFILTKWHFSDELAIVPKEFLNFERQVEQADYADVVMIANLQTYVGSNHPYCRMQWSKISAFSRLGMDPEIEINEIEELSDDLETAKNLLT